MSRANINVHIEELVLHGIDPTDRHAIAAAIQREIARTLAAQGPSITDDRHVDRIQGRPVPWGDAAGPQRVGAEVARAMRGNLTPGTPTR